jgi:probable phosphoglycerate mutase
MELVLVRHGEPVHEGGRETVDPELSAEGRAQAARAGRRLAREGGVEALFSSPLKRAYGTAEAIAEALGLEIQVLDGLAEADAYSRDPTYVRLEELRRDAVRFRAFLADPLAFLGADASRFTAAVRDAFDALAAQNDRRRIVAVTHGLPINLMLADVLGLERLLSFAPDYGSLTRVQIASPRALERGLPARLVRSINEAGHHVP